MEQIRWDYHARLAFILSAYWLARKLRLRKLEQRFGFKLFNFMMSYANSNGFRITIEKSYD